MKKLQKDYGFTIVIDVIINGPVEKFQRLAHILNADLHIGTNKE